MPFNPNYVGSSPGYTDRSTYRQYDEYCGTRQRDRLLFLYKYPCFQCVYDPWTGKLQLPHTSPSPSPSSSPSPSPSSSPSSSPSPTVVPTTPPSISSNSVGMKTSLPMTSIPRPATYANYIPF